MEALRQSVERNRAARAGQQTKAAKSGSSAGSKRATQKASDKKPAAKKAAGKKAPARSTGQEERQGGEKGELSPSRGAGSPADEGEVPAHVRFTPYPECRQARPGRRGVDMGIGTGNLADRDRGDLSVRAELGHSVRHRTTRSGSSCWWLAC